MGLELSRAPHCFSSSTFTKNDYAGPARKKKVSDSDDDDDDDNEYEAASIAVWNVWEAIWQANLTHHMYSLSPSTLFPILLTWFVRI